MAKNVRFGHSCLAKTLTLSSNIASFLCFVVVYLPSGEQLINVNDFYILFAFCCLVAESVLLEFYLLTISFPRISLTNIGAYSEERNIRNESELHTFLWLCEFSMVV